MTRSTRGPAAHRKTWAPGPALSSTAVGRLGIPALPRHTRDDTWMHRLLNRWR